MEEVIIAELVELEEQRPTFNAPNWLVGILIIKIALALYVFSTLVQGHANESDWIALTILLSSAAWARVRYCQLWKTSPLFRLMRSFGSAIALEMLIWGVVFFAAAICHGVSKYLL